MNDSQAARPLGNPFPDHGAGPPAPTQLTLGGPEGNHPVVQARQRAVAAAVLAGPFKARHREVMWWLCAHADRRGEVVPQVLTAGRLADLLGRDNSGVCRDIRDLERAGHVWRRPIPGSRGPLFTYWIPGMQDPLRAVE